MFRITPYLYKTILLVNRHTPSSTAAASISRYPPAQYKKSHDKERDTCPAPPRVVKPPPNDGTFWGFITVLVFAGGFAVYAKQNPEVRDWLSLRAAWFDDLIAILYQENMTYLEFVMSCVEDTKKSLADFLEDGRPRDCDLEMTVEPKPVNYKEPGSPCDRLPAPVVTKDICEVEACMKELGDGILQRYKEAKEACTQYNKLVDRTMRKFTYSGMKKLRQEMGNRLETVQKAVDDAEANNAQLGDLTRYLECGVTSEVSKIENTRQMLQDYQDKIKISNIEYIWENDRSLALDQQWQQVEAVVEKYVTEMKMMYPGLDYDSEKPQITGDGDLMLHHSWRYVQMLEAQMWEQVEAMAIRAERGIETLPQSEAKRKERDALIKSLYNKKKAELDKEFANRYAELKQDNDNATKEALKKQQLKHEESVARRVKEREKDALIRFDKIVAEKVAAQKKIFDKALRVMALKLQVVEGKLNDRLKAERETKRAQELWVAGSSLLAATKKGDPYVKVTKELRAIEKASGDNDQLVLSVLRAIPQSVWEEGLVPESVLRQKYHSMERVALNVALVEDDGAPLPIYAYSWLQSMFLFMKLSTIPQAELDNPPKEPYKFKHLDTFDLLQRARYFVERGNLAAAVRYVSALEGASKGAAHAWHEAARAHLEARQAAEAILAHAAAMGIQYL